MTKMSQTRKVKKGVAEKRNFNPLEIIELQELQRLVNARRFEAAQIKANTALVPRGQEIASEIEAIARVMENAKNLYVAQKLVECGYPSGTKCDINFSTGEITLHKDEPGTV